MFFPCYNDAHTIGHMVEEADRVGMTLSDDYEILVIDDGSTDGSRELLKSLLKRYPRLVLEFHPRNLGYGGALQSGFRLARKELVFYTDGDAQYHVDELPLLWKALGRDVDVVNGYKTKRADPWYRALLGGLYLRLVRRIFGAPIRDIDCDFRLIRRQALSSVQLRHRSGASPLELVTIPKKMSSTTVTITESTR